MFPALGLLTGAGRQALYCYMRQLKQLERYRCTLPRSLPPHLAEITTLLRVPAWKETLRSHPDKEFAEYTCQAASSNLISADQQLAVVDDYIGKEVREGRIAEVTDPTGLLGLQVSPFGVIPKKEAGKWRLIVDLSFPEGVSVNNGIEKNLCSLEYVTVDHIAAGVYILGKVQCWQNWI